MEEKKNKFTYHELIELTRFVYGLSVGFIERIKMMRKGMLVNSDSERLR